MADHQLDIVAALAPVAFFAMASLAMGFAFIVHLADNIRDMRAGIRGLRWVTHTMCACATVLFGQALMQSAHVLVEQQFLHAQPAVQAGYFGREGIREVLRAHPDGICNSVSRTDGGDVFPYLDPAAPGQQICGVSWSYLDKNSLIPFTKSGARYQIMVGRWPRNYVLVVERSDVMIEQPAIADPPSFSPLTLQRSRTHLTNAKTIAMWALIRNET